MKEDIPQSVETEHTKCFIKSIKIISFLHNRIWLEFNPHGDPVETLGPQLDDHLGLPSKIIEWSNKFSSFLHLSCTTCDKNVVDPARQTLKFSRNMP